MEWSCKLRESHSTKHAGILLGVDALFLSEALDTVRLILLPCWATHSANLSLSSRRQTEPFSKILGVKVLQHLFLILFGTKKFRTAPARDRCLWFPFLSLYFEPALQTTSMKTLPKILLTRREVCVFRLARHLDKDDIGLLCFTQD